MWGEGTKERSLIALLDFVRHGYIGVSLEYRLTSEATFAIGEKYREEMLKFLDRNFQ